MKRLFLSIFVFLLLAGGANFLGAFEIEAIGGVDGFTFQPDKTSAFTDLSPDKQFVSFPYGFVNLTFRHNISESLNYSINLERDNVLQNSINALFGAKSDYYNVKFGPFLGLTDDFNIPDVGIIGSLELYIPGIVSLAISGSSTLGSQYEFTSNNFRETVGIKLGFWMENSAIPSFSVNIKNLSRQVNESLLNDAMYRYLFNLELFAKNSKFSGNITLGYQTYTRVYKKSGLESTEELSSYLAGFGLSWQVIQPLCIKAGLEIPFLVATTDPMFVTQSFIYSRIFAGVVYLIK